VRVGPFEIEREIARGGAGAVYLARDPAGERVALKLLERSQGAADQARERRYQREVQSLLQLRHPGIVALRGAGEEGRWRWLALDYVEGGTLAQRLDEGPLPIAEGVALVAELADAVAYAHERDVLHRDLKPANVLLRAEDGRPLLADFGLARAVEDASRLSVTGALLGTPGYWPPEQARGELSAIGPRSDVYGLGAVLYACLTGRAPIEGASLVEIAARTDSGEVSSPASLRPETPRALASLCLACLAVDPASRPASAAALASSLRALSLEPPRAPRVGATRLAAGALVVLALGGGSALVARGREVASASRSSTSPPPAQGRIDLAAIVSRARVLGEEGDRLAAIGLLADALIDHPDAFELLAEQALQRMRHGDLELALAAAERLVELYPERGAAYDVRARVKEERQELKSALADAERALALAPETPVHWITACRLRSLTGDHAGALLAARRAMELAPESLLARRSLAVELGIGGQLRESAELLEEVVARDPSDAAAWLNLAGATRSSAPRRAIEAATRARELSEDPAIVRAAWVNEAVAQERLKERALALEAYGRALNVDPDLAVGLQNRARLLLQLERYEEARRDLERTQRLAPDDPATWRWSHELYARTGPPAEATRCLRRWIELEVDLARLQKLTKKLCGGRRPDLVHGEMALSRLLALQPDEPLGLLNRGLVRKLRGEVAGARRDWERFLELYPERTEAARVRAMLGRLGR